MFSLLKRPTTDSPAPTLRQIAIFLYCLLIRKGIPIAGMPLLVYFLSALESDFLAMLQEECHGGAVADFGGTEILDRTGVLIERVEREGLTH